MASEKVYTLRDYRNEANFTNYRDFEHTFKPRGVLDREQLCSLLTALIYCRPVPERTVRTEVIGYLTTFLDINSANDVSQHFLHYFLTAPLEWLETALQYNLDPNATGIRGTILYQYICFGDECILEKWKRVQVCLRYWFKPVPMSKKTYIKIAQFFEDLSKEETFQDPEKRKILDKVGRKMLGFPESTLMGGPPESTLDDEAKITHADKVLTGEILVIGASKNLEWRDLVRFCSAKDNWKHLYNDPMFFLKHDPLLHDLEMGLYTEREVYHRSVSLLETEWSGKDPAEYHQPQVPFGEEKISVKTFLLKAKESWEREERRK